MKEELKNTCTCQELENIEKIIGNYRERKGTLVDVLHDIQHELGYLPDYALRLVAKELGYSEAQVFGVASFYSGFYFTPRPKNQIKVCVGTACHVRGAPKVIKEFESLLGISPGENTEDMLVGLETVSCVGCCALAPVIVVNGTVARNTTPQRIAFQLTKGAKGEGVK